MQLKLSPALHEMNHKKPYFKERLRKSPYCSCIYAKLMHYLKKAGHKAAMNRGDYGTVLGLSASLDPDKQYT